MKNPFYGVLTGWGVMTALTALIIWPPPTSWWFVQSCVGITLSIGAVWFRFVRTGG